MEKILYIYCGDNDKNYPNEDHDVKAYSLGIGRIKGQNVLSINDPKKLNNIATSNADVYTDFVYKQNQEFISKNLIYMERLSLYFLTDFSCKRSEIFSTYSNFCNSIFIKDFLEENKIDKVIFDGCNKDTFQSINSVIGKIDYKRKAIKDDSLLLSYVLIKNITFFLKLVIGVFIRSIFISRRKTQKKEVKNLFLTRYPLHLNNNLHEDKFGDLVSDKDIFLVNLLTDGLHQNLGIKDYLIATKKLASIEKVRILDDYLSIKDILASFLYSVVLIFKFRPILSKRYNLQNIDLTESIKKELYFSLIRLPRLLMWLNPLNKFFNSISVKKIYYYLHEYPYGRMITFFLNSLSPKTKSVGFQHGPASLRKLLYMAASNELSISANGINSFPLPNMVLAEDEFSKNIYLSAGYKNVHIMNKIYRLDYLKQVDRCVSLKDISLIAPGLHDGEFLMMSLHDQIKNNHKINYILKPHPRANNKYVDKYRYLNNLTVSNASIIEELSKVDKVYATYSSVGIEANFLGIDVEIIEIPGKINESPLIDKEFLHKPSF